MNPTGTEQPEPHSGQQEFPDLQWNPRTQPKQRLSKQRLRMVSALISGQAKLAKWVRSKLSHDIWSIGIAPIPIHAFVHSSPSSVFWLPEIEPNGYLADPFGFIDDGQISILLERFDYLSGRGELVQLNPFGEHGDLLPVPGLDLPNCHASFPYIFQHSGAIYCVPETARARCCFLFRYSRSHRRWEKVVSLLEGIAAVDPTIINYQEKWWLFCTNQDADANSELLCFYAYRPEGPWLPHQGNPVKIDLVGARSAGSPFLHEGQLYRPTQDCSLTYGGSIIIQHVAHLSPTEFREIPVNRIGPDKAGGYPNGLHMISPLGEMTLVDGKRQALKSHRYLLRSLTNRINSGWHTP